MSALLDVIIATHGPAGLSAVAGMILPAVDGVRYIVTWQAADNHHLTPEEEALGLRADVEVHRIDSIGLSRNRNAGIELATAPVLLIADNDLNYTAAQLLDVINTFTSRPEVDVACFRYLGASKHYPTEECDLTTRIPKNYYPTSFEIAFRKQSIGRLRFDERFGLGTPFGIGEEEIFINDCRRNNLNVRFFPIDITSHPHSTTGERPVASVSVARGIGALHRYLFGLPAGIARSVLKAWRLSRKGQYPLLTGLFNITHGAIFFRPRHSSKKI